MSSVLTHTQKIMADFRPFEAIRYNPKKVDFSNIIAPPYDVINPRQQEELYRRSEYNCIRLILNKEEAADTDQNNRYTRARKFFEDWIQKQILTREEPAFYLYRQIFKDPRHGTMQTRLALIGRLKLEEFEKGVVIPHEKTLSKPRADRRRLLEATHTNFSAVFGLYEDPQKELSLLEKHVLLHPALFEVADDQQVKHGLWMLRDENELALIQAALRKRKIYIADGHHRYQTALEYSRDRRKELGVSGDTELPSDFVLMALVNIDEPGLLLLPTHRMITSYPGFNRKIAVEALKTAFDVIPMKIEEIQKSLQTLRDKDNVFGLCLPANENYLLKLKDFALAKQEMPKGRSDAWYQLDVNVLNFLIFGKLWKLEENLREGVITYTHDEAEALQAVRDHKAEASFLLKAPAVQILPQIGKQQELMPQKSTYFYPKLISGLVFYPHD